jgi:hypothetical protein
MREIEHLQKQWRESARFRGLHASMSLQRDALVLGAGTVLVKRNTDGALMMDGEEEKLLTLLSVAHGRPIGTSVLKSFRRASDCAKAGDACMASMHVALALPAFRDPSDASRRLFIAEGLLAKGAHPRGVWTALEFDPAPLDALEKEYNPNQLRVPAGNGRPSGRWMRDGTVSEAKTPSSVAARVTRQIGTQTTETSALEAEAELPIIESSAWLALLSRVAPPTAFLSALLYSPPAGGEHHEGDVLGRPDLRFSWDEDGIHLYVTRKSDGQTVLQATPGANGVFYTGKKRAVARLFGEHLLVDPAALPPEDPRSTQDSDNRPRQCPEPPTLDKPQGTARSKAYVLYAKDLVNQPPTPAGLGYQLSNPFAGGDTVHYDDCQRSSGTMIEYKGPTYAEQLVNPYYGDEFKRDLAEEWLDQATRQIEASGGRPVAWYFAEQPALQFARALFSQHAILQRIKLVYAPPPEDWTWQ